MPVNSDLVTLKRRLVEMQVFAASIQGKRGGLPGKGGCDLVTLVFLILGALECKFDAVPGEKGKLPWRKVVNGGLTLLILVLFNLGCLC